MGQVLVYSEVPLEKQVFTCEETLRPPLPRLVNTLSFKGNVVRTCIVRRCPDLGSMANASDWKPLRENLDQQLESVVKSCWFTKRKCVCTNVGKKETSNSMFMLVAKCLFCCVATSAWSQKTFSLASCIPPQHYWALQILPPRTAGWRKLLIWLSAGQRTEQGCLSQNSNNNTFHTHLGVVDIL